jgi:hypothetical protein
MSLTPASVVNIEPMNFRQVFKEKQQLMSIRPVCSTFQQTGGIRNVAIGSFTRRCWRRGKEVYEAVIVRIRSWVEEKAFNSLSTLVDDQRGRIEVSAAIRIKEEVTHPIQNIVSQDIFVFDLFMDTNQTWVFIYNPPQGLSIRGLTDVLYCPEGFGHKSHFKCKVYCY